MFSHPTFGAWLRARRRAHDLTQVELAQHVGCAEITIRKIETDRLRPSRELIIHLLSALRVAPSEHATYLEWARRR